MKAKCLIKRYFNIGHYIATIRKTNINPSILYARIVRSGDILYLLAIHMVPNIRNVMVLINSNTREK